MDGVTLSNQILWWLLESSDLCVILHCHAEARFLLDSCEAKLIWNASRVQWVSWYRCQSWLSPFSALRPQELLLHSPRRQWSLPCLLTNCFNFLFCGNWRWCHSMDCPFVSSLIWWNRFASFLTVWVRNVSPLALKRSNNWKKWPFSRFYVGPWGWEDLTDSFLATRNSVTALHYISLTDSFVRRCCSSVVCL